MAGRVASLGVALALYLAGPAAAATFYVDQQSATCNDMGPGTEAEPYCTISAAVAAHKGADVAIVVKPGTYREQVTIPASGAAGLPYVIRAQGPGVFVDGSDDFASPGLWAPTTGTEFLAASVTDTVRQVFVDGARLTPSAAAPGLLPVGSFTWVLGQGLHANLGGDNPGAHQTLVGRRLHGFNLFGKSFVTIEGFEIARVESRGINLQTGCSDLVISRNQVSFANSYGIQTVNGQRIVIDGNVISDGNFHGIGLTAGASACVVSNNESFRNADPDVRRANGIHLFGAPGNTLFGNRLHDNQDTGMQFSSGSNECIAYNNRCWNNGDHGFDHLASTGVSHTNDVAYGNLKDGFSFEGFASGGSVFNCIAVNNGLATDEFDLFVDLDSSVGFTSDRNILWNAAAQDPIKFGGIRYPLLADYQLATGRDAHSVQADPRFVDGAAGDFHLTPGSPAIDAADSGAPKWPATDAEGTARFDHLATVDTGAGPVTYSDIGALEFVPVDSPPVVTAPHVIKVTPGAVVTFTVTASDVDGDPIGSLVLVESKMPANSGATFAVDGNNASGTFTWPAGTSSGNFHVRFIATNALADTAQTVIQVRSKGRSLALSEAFPNPSAGTVEFALDLPDDAEVRWTVYDLHGRKVWSVDRRFAAGRQSLHWDGTVQGRGQAPPGVYLVGTWVEGALFTRRVVRF